MAKKPKRRARGKAKPVSIEAERLARWIERLRRLQANPPLHKENRAAVCWGRQWIGERLSDADNEIFDRVARELRRGEAKAERVIRAYWSIWDVQGLKWGERALEMSKLGFNQFKDMSPTSFKTLCTRRLELKYRPTK